MKKINPTAVMILIVSISMAASVVTYSYQGGVKSRTLTTLEVIQSTKETLIVKNTGPNLATDLTSDPPAVFVPQSIGPGEESTGTFEKRLRGFTVITVSSTEGSEVIHKYLSFDIYKSSQPL